MSMRSDRPWNRSVLARLVLAGLSAATVCHAATLVVPDDHATIQAAVNAAAAGDTVYIRPGVYSEVITVSGSVTLAGSQPSTTVIDGGGTGTVVHATGATNVVIRGLTIRNGHHGIHLDETHYSSITNCAIAENGLSGVYIYPKSSHNHITDCDIFSNCLSNSDWSGLNLGDWHDQQYNVFSSCNIYSNAGDGVAGWITTDHTQVHDCTIYGNRRGIVVGWSQWSISGCSIYSNVEHGILLDSVKSTLITNCWLACSSCGMELAGTGGTYDNVIADNRVESNGQGFNVTSLVRRTLVVGNRIAGNAKGIYIVCNESRPCYDNTFYGNDFIGNTVHAQVDEDRYSNTWDNGYPAGGNYWEDYAGVDDYGGPNQDQAGSDGIGDTAYTVSAGNVDRYPRYAFSETFSLTVTSVFGNPTPATGIHQLPRLSSVAGSVEVPASGSHTQHVCTGWTGSGSVPPSGSDTNLQFVIAQPSTLTWQWRTDYRFEGAADSGGDVSLTSGWYADGTVLTVEAVPAGGYAFVGWAGDVPAGSAGMNPLSLTMDRARSIRAQFAAVREWVVPTEFPTIQAALNAAHAYDVVHVSAGTYPEVLTLGRPVTLEGEGAAVTTIDGGGTGTVIRVAGTTNVVIRGLTVRNGHHGIHLDDTHWSRIANCVVAEHQKCGVYLYPKSSHNEVTDCEIFHTCQADSGWSGLNLGDFQGQQHNVFSSCNIYSNLGAGIVGYVTTDDTRVHDCNIWENLHGIIVGWSQWSISGCTIQSNGSHGIILDTARNGLITNCLVSANAYGVEFAGWGPYYNLVVDNSIDANGHGLAMTCQARYNMVLHNRLSRNDEGLFVVRNQDHPCYDNTFYGNDFAGNTVQARIEEDRYSNTWDNGYPAGGNYWDDYAGADVQSGPNQDQAGSDGIGDTAYVVTNANVDRYPKYELPAVVGLTVESVYGNPSPAVGEHLVPRWSSVACSVEAVVSGNFTQRVCTGWTGTGSVPADGVTSNVEVMMTQPSTLTWLWRTDYRFEGQADPGGALSATSDWYEAGTVLTVAASVSNGYRFVGWAGDVPPGQEGANPLDLTMDRARSIRALFSAMTEWVVPTDSPTIQAALDAAGAYDVVRVLAGTYPETLTIGRAVTLEGAGAGLTVIDGGGTGTVIHATGATNVVIRGLTVRNGHHGVQLDSTHYSSLTNCAIAENGNCGVYMRLGSSHNEITDCDVFRNCLTDSGWSGLNLSDTHNQQHNRFSCCNVYSNEGAGIVGYSTTDNTQVENCTVYRNPSGIIVGHSQWTISGCSVYSNVHNGIVLDSAKSTLMTNCWVAYSSCGMELAGTGGTYDSVIADNRVESNTKGLNLTCLARRTLVVGNRITANATGVAIVRNEAYPCRDNTFYGNDFIGNTLHAQVAEDRYSNTWDNGYPAGGNYWDDYTGVDDYSGPNQDLPGSDLVGDAPLVIDARNRDRYPLMTHEDRAPLQVVSQHGAPDPAVGQHVYPAGTVVTCSVDSVVSGGSATQYACVGWTGTGSIPADGATNELQFAIRESSTLTWNWATNYWLALDCTCVGNLSMADDWVDAGQTLTIAATPSPGFYFSAWTGDVPEASRLDNPLHLTVDGPKHIRAKFAAVSEIPRILGPEVNLCLNPTRTGYPDPSESDDGWGGGQDKWDMVDGLRTYPGEWARGLAFTGGDTPYVEPCGDRQATVDFGEPKTFSRVVIWHHTAGDIPHTYRIQYWNGAAWIDAFSTTNGRQYAKYANQPDAGWWSTWSAAVENTFEPVTGSKVRFLFNNCDIVHGWIYEFEVFEYDVDVPLLRRARVLLQGPYSATDHAMANALQAGDRIPLTAPYASDSRTVCAVPDGAVDWVLIQFRETTNGPPVESRSVFLRCDGYLMADNGELDIPVNVSPNSTYYLVVKHRNHLSVMSSVEIAFTNHVASYDFAGQSDACFGGAGGAVALESGVWGMVAGDTDGDGAVMAADQQLYQTQLGFTGYWRGDLDLDGTVNPAEADVFLTPNDGCAGAAPSPGVALRPALTISPARKTVLPGETVALSVPGDTNSVYWTCVAGPSGGSFSSQSPTSAVYGAGSVPACVDIVQAWGCSNNLLGRSYINVISAEKVALLGKAMIVAGRKSVDDPLWPATEYLADMAYDTLRYRGYSEANIHYLSPNDGQPRADAPSTLENAANTLTNWAADADRLFVYLVDHGGTDATNGYFRLNPGEKLWAWQLDDWLDQMQAANTNLELAVVVDCCYAGTFVTALAEGDESNRVVIASGAADERTFFASGGLVSFSDAFFSGVMLGFDLSQCYDLARSAMEDYQSSMLDDNGDGACGGGDGAYASTLDVGATFVAGQDLPYTQNVSPDQLLMGDAAASLWAEVESIHALDRVWCLVIPPGHNPDPDNPVSDVPEVELLRNADTGRYEGMYGGFAEAGDYNLMFYARDCWGSVSLPRQGRITQMGYEERIILVAGGNTNDTAWEAVHYMADRAYHTFRARWFSADSILYLSPGNGGDVDGLASLANLADGVTNWAAAAAKLTLYVVGNATSNVFDLSDTDSLHVSDLATWLNSYQGSNKACCVVLDFPGSGGFMPGLAAPEAARICIASTEAGSPSIAAACGLISFSQFFLSNVFRGYSVRESFVRARTATRRASGALRQRSLLDDDGDGEPTKYDGEMAAGWHIGTAFMSGPDDIPEIARVTPSIVLDGTHVLTLWAEGVTDDDGISNVWCHITPPDYDGAGALPRLDLAWNGTTARYEAVCTDFVQPGTYACTFHAVDTEGEISAPVQCDVMLPDAYEPDDSDAEAAGVKFGTLQDHNLHLSNDEDWVQFIGVPEVDLYEICATQEGENSDLVLELYYRRNDGVLTNVYEAPTDDSAKGVGEMEETELCFPPFGIYYVRVRSVDGFGIGSEYSLEIAIPGAGAISTLYVVANDVMRPIGTFGAPPNATASLLDMDNQVLESCQMDSSEGYHPACFDGLPEGVYKVTVAAAGYWPEEDPAGAGGPDDLYSQYGRTQVVDLVNVEFWPTFQFYPMFRARGVVQDAFSHEPVPGVAVRFKAASGKCAGADYTDYQNTTWGLKWLTDADGSFPDDQDGDGILLPTASYDLYLVKEGYESTHFWGIVPNRPSPGQVMDLGVIKIRPDSDCDGLPDWWEATYFGAVDAVATNDPDGDGHDNRAEHRCGTDPTNANSVLRLDHSWTVAPSNFTLSFAWPVVSGRTYQVWSTDDLVSNVWTAVTDPCRITGDTPCMVWTAQPAVTQSNRFYQIQVNSE